MGVLRNLPKMATVLESRTGMHTPESLRNRALDSIRIIRKYRGKPKKVDACIREAWEIYARLQKILGAEFFVDNNEHFPNRTVSLDVLASPNIRSGGLGFRHVNWDAEFMMAKPKGHRRMNPFWNPTSGKRDENGILLNLEDSDYWVYKKKGKK